MRTQKRHVPKAQMTAAIWCRVSSKKQAGDEKSSLSTQERYCRDEVKRLGAVVDEAHALLLPESASEPEARDTFEWLMREADRHAFDMLVVDVQDRLTRGGMADFFIIQGRLVKAGVDLIIVREEYTSGNDNADMLAGMRAWMAKRENEDRVRRSLDGKQGRIERGRGLPGATSLYGYQWVDPQPGKKTTRRFDDVDSEAYQTVQRIWQYYLTDPAPTLHALAQQLTKEGVKSPSAYCGVRGSTNRWTAETIRLILHTDVYWGGDADGMITHFRDSKYRSPIQMPTTAPAYVTRQQAAYVHERLRLNGRYAARRRKRDWAADGVLLYGGLARCADCGWALTPHQIKLPRKDGSPRIIYRCTKATTHGSRACKGVTISAKTLDFAVIFAIHSHLGGADYLHRLFEAWDRDAVGASAHVQRIAAQLADMHTKVQRAAAYILEHGEQDPLTPEMRAQAHLIRDEVPLLEARLRKAQQAVNEVRHNPALRDEMVAWFEAWTDGFEVLDIPRQRLFLQALNAQVRVWRAGERTPQARLSLELPTTIRILPPPMDVAAQRAAFGDDVDVDEEGLYLDIAQANHLLRSPLIFTDASARSPVDTGYPEGYTAEDVMTWAVEERTEPTTHLPIASRTRTAHPTGRDRDNAPG